MNSRLWVLALGLFLTIFESQAQDAPAPERLDNGKAVYEASCLACHQADGSGIPNLAPPLIKGQFINGDKAKLIEIVLKGMEGVEIKGETYFNPMPPFDYLPDQDIADVLTYIRNNFENQGGAVSLEEVKASRTP